MILLRPDYLVFELPSGEAIPCSAEEVAAELVVESDAGVDPSIVKDAAAAVLHYFKSELGRTGVSIGEFTEALKRALATFGFNVVENPVSLSTTVIQAPPLVPVPVKVMENLPQSQANLASIGKSSADVGELVFYQRLRQDIRDRLQEAPGQVRYSGLRECAQVLCASKRWTSRCQRMSDEIVHFLRACLRENPSVHGCSLQILS